MERNTVLIVDEDRHRLEKLLFMVQLGGYKARSFENTAAVLNWIKYAGEPSQILCLLFNCPLELVRIEEIFADLVAAAGVLVPVVSVQRGEVCKPNLCARGTIDHVFICEPECIMQTLDILADIGYSCSPDGGCPEANHGCM